MYVPFSVSPVLFVCKCVLLSPGVNPIAVKYIPRYRYYRKLISLKMSDTSNLTLSESTAQLITWCFYNKSAYYIQTSP
jgi:hypothetical protein